jgi:hypothetical protein
MARRPKRKLALADAPTNMALVRHVKAKLEAIDGLPEPFGTLGVGLALNLLAKEIAIDVDGEEIPFRPQEAAALSMLSLAECAAKLCGWSPSWNSHRAPTGEEGRHVRRDSVDPAEGVTGDAPSAPEGGGKPSTPPSASSGMRLRTRRGR